MAAKKDRDNQTDYDNVRNTYVLTATVIDGTIRLTGEGLQGDTIETPRGEDAVVKIRDADRYYLYGTQVPPDGEQSACWNRDASSGLAQQKFLAVSTEINNIVFAASTSNAGDVVYGPVLKVKPTG